MNIYVSMDQYNISSTNIRIKTFIPNELLCTHKFLSAKKFSEFFSLNFKLKRKTFLRLLSLSKMLHTILVCIFRWIAPFPCTIFSLIIFLFRVFYNIIPMEAYCFASTSRPDLNGFIKMSNAYTILEHGGGATCYKRHVNSLEFTIN